MPHRPKCRGRRAAPQRDRLASRRRRLRAIVEAAVADGTLPPATDVDLTVAGCTGTLYALALAGEPIDGAWPARMTAQVFGDG